MKKNLISLAVLTTLGLSAFAASAEDMYRGSWYLRAGGSFMNTDSDLDADNGKGLFISVGKELSPSWDIQARLGYNKADEDTGISGFGGDYKSTQLGLDALYMFSRDNFRPFLLAGLGATRNDLDYSAPAGFDVRDSAKTSWMGNLGAGFQYLFSDSFGLQADVRQQWSRAKAKIVDSGTGQTVSESGSVSNTLLSLGGIFRFGAPAPVVAEAAPEPAPIPVAEPAPEPMPEPAPEPVKCTPKFETITVKTEELFGFDKAKLKADGEAMLNQAADRIKANPDVELIMVTGHTDRIGSEAYNQKLSERRANMVKDYLVAQGIDANRLQAVGKGESEPVANCTGVKGKKLIECLAPDRRVVISAEKQRESGCQ
jgi:OmpA-OmpF porin, OOP family